MWNFIAKLILRNRIIILLLVAISTAFMAYQATFIEMEYGHAPLLPQNDSVSIQYHEFKEKFGSDRGLMLLAVRDSDFFEVEKIRDWMHLRDTLLTFDGVESAVTITNLLYLRKDTSKQKFTFEPIFKDYPETKADVDSLKEKIINLPFYENRLYKSKSDLYLMGIALNKDILATKAREDLVDNVVNASEEFRQKHKIEFHYSGMPYIQTRTAQMIREELVMFIVLAAIATLTIMFLFFHSGKATFFSMTVVAIGVIWAFGTMALFGYKMTVLTGIIPPLLIVIGIPNSIFLLNKYHAEYLSHGNKTRALVRIIQKVGKATLLTNVTTASGFATFIFTESNILKEFGVVASLNILGVFLWSLLLIPIFFSFYPPPSKRHTKHLDRKGLRKIVETLLHITLHHRKASYIATVIIVTTGFVGVFQIQREGKVVNDIPHDHDLFVSLKMIEHELGGVMPLEIVVDTKKPRKARSLGTMKKIERLTEKIQKYPDFAKPTSIVDAAKYARQAFYNGDSSFYSLPSTREMSFMGKYMPKIEGEGSDLVASYIDKEQQIARISIQMKDVGAQRMKILSDSLRSDINSIFNPKKYDVKLTGFSMLFAKGADYLVESMFLSLFLAVVLIALFMAAMFREWRMVLVSLIPNLIPLILTAALMGFFNIPIKPSTVLVFSIAFGISVDDTIHFLAKYRQELKVYNGAIRQSVISALRETGISMMYTSVVLFFGFGIFVASEFGGTIALGLLVSFTLLVAMFANLILLPSLLLSLEKLITTKAFRDNL